MLEVARKNTEDLQAAARGTKDLNTTLHFLAGEYVHTTALDAVEAALDEARAVEFLLQSVLVRSR